MDSCGSTHKVHLAYVAHPIRWQQVGTSPTAAFSLHTDGDRGYAPSLRDVTENL